MLRQTVLATFATLFVCMAAPSCGGESSTPSTAADTGTTDSGSSTFKVVKTCTTEAMYIDATGDASKAKVTPWDTSLGSKGCIKIKKGTAVTWNPAPSANHPLEPAGGDSGNPITNTATVTFSEVGTFGFQCGNHSEMQGAVWVVP